MRFRSRAAIDIEGDAEVLKALLNHAVIAVDDVLRRHALLFGANGDRHAVLIRAADEDDVLLLQAKIADINISRYVDTCQVAYMYAAVGIRKSRGDGSAFEFFIHNQIKFFIVCKITKYS